MHLYYSHATKAVLQRKCKMKATSSRNVALQVFWNGKVSQHYNYIKYLGVTKEFYQRGFWKFHPSLNRVQPNRCSEGTIEALSGLPKEGLIEKLLSLVKLAFPSWRPVNQHYSAIAFFAYTSGPGGSILVAWLWLQECSQICLKEQTM